MRARPIVVLVAVVVFGVALAASASTGNITLDFQVVRGAPGSVHQLYSGAMPVVGEVCEVTASDAGNNTSVHPGNHLQLATGGGAIFFNDVERAPNVSTPGSASGIIPGETGVVTLILGPDGIYSADLTLEFTCTTTTTTTATSSTTTTQPETSTSVTTPSTTTTSTSPATTTTAPSTTTTTECLHNPPETICELPYTGPESGLTALLAAGMVLAGLVTLGVAGRER